MTTPTVTTSTSAAPSAANVLQSRAMLVDLNLRCWTALKTDKEATQEVAQTHGSDVAMATVKKQLIPTSYLEPIKKRIEMARSEHLSRTLPWASKARIIAASGYAAYAAAMRVHQDSLVPLVDALCNAWAAAMDEAEVRLNGLFRRSEYPSAAQVRAKYAIEWNVYPVPAAADFRVDLAESEVARLRRHIEETAAAALAESDRERSDRIAEVVGRMSERLHAYTLTVDANGKQRTEGAFKDSLVENVRDLVSLMPSLNLTGDARLTALAARMESELTRYSAQALRDSTDKRAEVAAAADSILAEAAAIAAAVESFI